MSITHLGRKLFSAADQRSFAALSGDWNPMHMDPVLARRTQAGAPVVHGVHTALVGLELAAASLELPAISVVKAVFSKMIYVGDTVDYVLTTRSEAMAVVEARIDDLPVTRISLTFGPPRPAGFAVDGGGGEVSRPPAPLELQFEEMARQRGWVGVPAAAEDVAAAFPAAARAWSAERILAMLGTTLLVGMVCPGLHSIFGGLTLNACEDDGAAGVLGFRVATADARFRIVRMQVAGGGAWGTLESFARLPPVPQPAVEDLDGLVAADEFAGSTALVVGGSRGLGELTAKLLTRGGAKVMITYATGRADAETLADSLRRWGGDCEVLKYDFRLPAAAQLQENAGRFSHYYYFATPQIFRRKAGLFDAARLAEFEACYVSGFYDLFQTLHAGAAAGLAAFYPSTVFVEARPDGMTEYAMAKLAGEALCVDMAAALPDSRIVVARLPRLPTDQTATTTPVQMADPVQVMLPLIRQVQGQEPPIERAAALAAEAL